MTECAFCGHNAISGFVPAFAESGICSSCLSSLAESLAKQDKLKVKELEREIANIKREIGMR